MEFKFKLNFELLLFSFLIAIATAMVLMMVGLGVSALFFKFGPSAVIIVGMFCALWAGIAYLLKKTNAL